MPDPDDPSTYRGWPPGASEMTERVAAHDWAATPLGAPDGWPAALKTLAGLMLASGQPMFMAWGPARIWLYNDAFVPILGGKHPQALGRPALEVWDEAREQLAPLFDRVFAGEAVHMQDFALQLDRRGRLEEAHFAFSYTPARDEAGRVAGLFGACIETTQQVLAERRQAEAQLRQRQVFEQAPGFIAILHGPTHVFEFANRAFARVVGGRPLLGRTVREAFPDLAGQGYHEHLDRVYATGERYVAFDVPVRLQATPGAPVDERHLDFIYEPVLDEAGAVTGIFIEGHDVSETHRVQAQLRLSERRHALLIELSDRFRTLDDPADLSFAAAELLGRAMNVSRAGYGTVDLAAETITIERDWNAPGIRSLAGVLRFRDYGSYIDDLKRGETVVFADAEHDPRTRANAAALKAISAQAVINMPVTEHDGLVALLYLNHAEPREWTAEELAFVRDVAERTRNAVERRRAERELLALTASLEQQVAERTAERDRVWRNSRDLLVVIGADGIFRAVNPAWTTILGYAPHEVAGRSFLDFVWPEDAERTQGGLDTAATRHDLTAFENRYRHRDGTPRWISWHTSVEGDLVYAYGRDITAQKVQAEALRHAEEALRQSQKLEAMGQLTGGVAHDFNNLLGVVGNNVYLHRRMSPACEHSPQLAAIARATDTGARLTRQLLAFARRQAIRPEAVRLQQELPELREVLKATMGGQVELRIEVAPDTPAIKVDRSEFELALLNLAMNARDAMPQGGVLNIRARRAPAPEATVVLEVADTGEGIAAEILPRVLEPFFTTKESGRGTGLGLSQVYGFATQAGGRFAIASTPGTSTTVTLTFPASFEAAAEAAPPPAAAAARLDACILLVEDNPELRATTQHLLEVAGCEVLQQPSGDAAARYLEAHPQARIDLVLSDVVLPGALSGVGLARWIERERPRLPVLLVTGYSTEMAAAREQGFTVLQKPVAPQQLIEAVGRALGTAG